MLNCPRLGGYRLRAGASPASVRLTPGKPSVMSNRGCSFVAERTWIKAPTLCVWRFCGPCVAGKGPLPPTYGPLPLPSPQACSDAPSPLHHHNSLQTHAACFQGCLISLSAIYKRKAVFVPCIYTYAEMKPGWWWWWWAARGGYAAAAAAHVGVDAAAASAAAAAAATSVLN